MRFIKKNKLLLVGVLFGALGGYLYYSFYGCRSGSCAITSSPLNAVAYGSLVGGLLFSSIKQSPTEQGKKKKDQEAAADN